MHARRITDRLSGAVAGLLVVLLFTAHSARAAGVVGNGTSASCTDTALNTALTGGGLVTFNCGASPVTIDISPVTGGTGTKTIGFATTIDGSGAEITLSGHNVVPVISVSSGRSLTLNNLTIANGRATFADGGGGVAVGINSTATVTNCTFTGNNTGAGLGGGIASYGTLAVANSTFSNNSTSGGFGGAIAVGAGGTSTVTNSTFANNSSYLGGGGIGTANYSGGTPAGQLTVTNSTFSNNSTSGGFGGAIAVGAGGTSTVTYSTFTNNSSYFGGGAIGTANYSGGTPADLTVSNSTFSLNRGNATGINVNSIGGGIGAGIGSTATITNSTFISNSLSSGLGGGIGSAGTLEVTNCTLIGNSAGAGSGGGIGILSGSTLKLTNSIVANSPSGINCAGPVTDGGHNLQFPGTACGASIPSADPLLDTGLADNGGPTQTVALEPGSPAINAGEATVCSAPSVNNLDQRGFVRPGTGHVNCSIGAYEADSPGPFTPTPTRTLARTPTPTGTQTLAATPTLTESAATPTATPTTTSTQPLTATSTPPPTNGSCMQPGPQGLVPCDAGTVVTVFVCQDRSCAPNRRVQVATTQTSAAGDFGVSLSRGQVGGKRLVLDATIVQGGSTQTAMRQAPSGTAVDYRIIIVDVGFVEAGMDVMIDPASEAATRLIDETGPQHYGDQEIADINQAVRTADLNINFAGVSPADAANMATETARQDPIVQAALPKVLCTGDCNASHAVTVDEILTMVNVALASADVSPCSVGDANDDGKITVDEILTAVNNALNGSACAPSA